MTCIPANRASFQMGLDLHLASMVVLRSYMSWKISTRGDCVGRKVRVLTWAFSITDGKVQPWYDGRGCGRKLAGGGKRGVVSCARAPLTSALNKYHLVRDHLEY